MHQEIHVEGCVEAKVANQLALGVQVAVAGLLVQLAWMEAVALALVPARLQAVSTGVLRPHPHTLAQAFAMGLTDGLMSGLRERNLAERNLTLTLFLNVYFGRILADESKHTVKEQTTKNYRCR